ncbi:hypothetical protein SAV14893_014040 [Streptomyces avermitilis]|uniref:Amine oxidase domain-containing protein n=1 Tax=Streptomyces avermitilis TaxID=33903 RepID=A0A4D4LK92_STRAX|nr:hypothetical protein SAVMC3_26240 [Streptomyces avermitilis]GDY62011.1 hypothetical protein SAV14893_014040 [Streptomyces avermitilis]
MSTTQTRTGMGQVVVIGGGIAGLAAAHRLLDRGARVTVLEASDRLGGKLLPGEIEGVRVDLGAESMLARRPEAVGLAREVGLADRLRPRPPPRRRSGPAAPCAPCPRATSWASRARRPRWPAC